MYENAVGRAQIGAEEAMGNFNDDEDGEYQPGIVKVDQAHPGMVCMWMLLWRWRSPEKL